MINNSNLKETKNLNQTNIEPNGLIDFLRYLFY